MSSKIRLGSLLLCAAGCAAPSDTLDPEGVALSALEAPRALHGVYSWEAPHGPQMVDAFGAWAGRQVDLAQAYAPSDGWSSWHSLGWQLPAWGGWVAARAGRELVYSLPMLPGPNDGSGPDGRRGTGDDVSLAACASGAYDTHYAAVGAALADAGLGAAIVRLGWEWDGDWFAWSSRGHESEYAGCFQHAVRAIRGARGGTSFKFEWGASDDIYQRTQAQIDATYPGDAYVDIVGVNAYDVSWANNSYPLPGGCDQSCLASRRENAWNDLMLGVFVARDFAQRHGKEISIPEWGLWDRADGHGGGDNADYIERMHAFVSDPNNRVHYQCYFDVNAPDGGHQISNLSGGGSNSTPGNSYRTLFPQAAEAYKNLFGAD